MDSLMHTVSKTKLHRHATFAPIVRRATLAAIAAGCSVLASPASAQDQPASGPLQQLRACSSVTDDAPRLACFDAAVAQLDQAVTAGRVVAIDREQVSTIERESFGFSIPSMANLLGRSSNPSERVERVEANVERVVHRGSGRISFVLNNGQTWTQTEPGEARNVDVGDSVTIRRAALGSFMLSPPNGASHRVRREQ